MQLGGCQPASHQHCAHRRRDGRSLEPRLPLGFFPFLRDLLHRRRVVASGGLLCLRQRGVHGRQGGPAIFAGLQVLLHRRPTLLRAHVVVVQGSRSCTMSWSSWSIKSLLQFLSCPEVGHPGPGLRLAEELPDLAEGQLPEGPQGEHLLLGLRQVVGAAGGAAWRASRSAKPLSSPSSPGSRSSSPRRFCSRHRERYWFRAIWHSHTRSWQSPRKLSMEARARKKVSWVTSSAVWASRLRARTLAVHVGKIHSVDLLKIRHGLTSLSAIGRGWSQFVTKKVSGVPDTFSLLPLAVRFRREDGPRRPGSAWTFRRPGFVSPGRSRSAAAPPHRTDTPLPSHAACSTGSAPRRLRPKPPPPGATGRFRPGSSRRTEARTRSRSRPFPPGAHASISLFFLWRHYIMEASDLQGGRWMQWRI